MKFKDILNEKNDDEDYYIGSLVISINDKSSVNIKFSNIQDAIDSLKKSGIPASKGYGKNDISVDITSKFDKTKLKNWMVINGWDIKDIRKFYPMLVHK